MVQKGYKICRKKTLKTLIYLKFPKFSEDKGMIRIFYFRTTDGVTIKAPLEETKMNSEEGSEESGDDFLDMSWPRGDWKKQLIYLFFLGITGPLYLLIPDVRREGKEKWVVFTFLNSIIAIAVYR